tara:strand:+ start:2941 stop:3249 length:309 start_codon:yes stop_codon:yes gene_type:complete
MKNQLTQIFKELLKEAGDPRKTVYYKNTESKYYFEDEKGERLTTSYVLATQNQIDAQLKFMSKDMRKGWKKIVPIIYVKSVESDNTYRTYKWNYENNAYEKI